MTIMDGGHRSGLGHGGEVTSSCKMPSDIRVRSSAEDTSPNRLPQEQCRCDVSLQVSSLPRAVGSKDSAFAAPDEGKYC